jgi:hypothetical protein
MIYSNLRFTILSLLIFIALNLDAQQRTMVNKIWHEVIGEPTDINWSKSIIDNSGKLLTTGNIKNSQNGSGLFLAKQNSDGQIIWQNSISPETPSSRNYGTAIYSNDSNEIYSAGVASLDGIASNNDYLITKYNSAGIEIWSTQIDSDNNNDDIPTSIISNNAGDVFITGSSIGEGTSFDFYTMKLNGINGTILWEERYNYTNRPDVPVALDFDTEGRLVVVGVSAKSDITWEIVALKYDSNNGTLLTEQRLSNDEIGFEEPTDFTKDASGNFYIVGRATTDGVNFDMLTAKLSSNLNLEWRKRVDEGKEDKAMAVAVDNAGNVFTTGYIGNSNQGSEFMTLKYKSNGTLEWKKRRTSDLSTSHARAFDVLVDAEDNVIVTGNIDYGATSIAVVTQYSPAGETMWERKINTENKAKPKNIVLSQSNEIYVTGISEDITGRSYFALKINRKKRDLTPFYSTEGEALYVKDEVLIRVESEYLNMDFVDDKGMLFGKVSDVISNSTVISTIDNTLGAEGDFHNWFITKVHRRLTSEHSTTTTRQGKIVPVPDFWATFILIIPRDYRGYGDAERVALSLNDETLNDYIRHAELNLIGSLDNCPPNDDRWHQQGNLHEITYEGVTFDAHINMEPGWCVETGNSNFKVGVMDSGLFWSHEDFGGPDFETSVVDGGADYNVGGEPIDISSSFGNDTDGHGTRVTGLIGAIRNNSIGVGGIAGGHDGTGGVRLFSYKVTKPALGSFSVLVSDAMEAYGDATILDDINLINNSWGFNPFESDEVLISGWFLRERLHFANRLGVILVASRGNSGTNEERYPGTIGDPWILTVGGSDLEGGYGGYNFGKNIDVIAPADWQLNRTTSNSSGVYDGISFTSGATPNVSGLAALLASHYLDEMSPNQNLVQEDVEYIIQRTADDIISDDPDQAEIDEGYDDFTGFGKINAGAALELAQQPNCNIFHFNRDTNHDDDFSISLVEENINLEVQGLYIKPNGQSLPHGNYIANVYKVTATYQHGLPSNFVYDDAWVRHTNSTVLNYHNNGILRPIETVNVISGDASEIILEGFVYELFGDEISTPAMVWAPQNVTDSNTDIAYSVLACNATDTNEEDINILNFNVFPNPTSNQLGIAFTLDITDDVIFDIFDTKGKLLISKKWEKEGNRRLVDAIDVTKLSSGAYICRLTTSKSITSQKFIKL